MMHADLNKEQKSLGSQCPMCRSVVSVEPHAFFGGAMRGDFVMCRSCRSFLTVVSLHPLRLELSGTRMMHRPDSY